LNQAEELAVAASAVTYAVRPLLLFYSLSQAGRAIAAAHLREKAELRGHGLSFTCDPIALVRDDAVEAVRAMKSSGSGLLSTIGSLSLCRSLLWAGLVDRFRVGMFPVITGATGEERIYDGYPDVAP
jgi:hypothetical protein